MPTSAEISITQGPLLPDTQTGNPLFMKTRSLVRNLRTFVPALSVLSLLLPGGATPAQAQGDYCPPGKKPEYVSGNAALFQVLGKEVMGSPLTCEYPDPIGTGDVHQKTEAGLAFWRKRLNIPTFTNGFNHWAITPNEPLAYWTGPSIDPPGFGGLPQGGGVFPEAQPGAIDGTATEFSPFETRPFESLTLADVTAYNVYLHRTGDDRLIPTFDSEKNVGSIMVKFPKGRPEILKLVQDAYESINDYPGISKVNTLIKGITFAKGATGGEVFVIDDVIGEGAGFVHHLSNYQQVTQRDYLAAWIIERAIVAEEAQKGNIAARIKSLSYENQSANWAKEAIDEWETRKKYGQEILNYATINRKAPLVIVLYNGVVSSAEKALTDLRAQQENAT